MFSKNFLSILIAAAILTAPTALAQSSDVQLSLTGPEAVQLQDTVRVVLEVADSSGNPVSGIEPEITFDPGEAVSAEWLYDCENPEFYDYCKANHRGVAGLFEIQFVLEQSPVLVEVNVGGVIEGLRLNTLELVAGAENSSNPEVPVRITPASVQAGPFMSFWFLAFPFMMLMSIVSFFVFSTTR
jgi:hypothetical protein